MLEAKNGKRVLVVNAMGRVFMEQLDDPFAAIERELEACRLREHADAIIVDFHAEATSEKQALGYILDGRVSLQVGTHTHAPTSDHRILPGGTAFVSDIGMCGDYESVLGMNKDEPIRRFQTKIPSARFEPATARRPSRGSRSRPTTLPAWRSRSRRCGSAACWKRQGLRSGLSNNLVITGPYLPARSAVLPVRDPVIHPACRRTWPFIMDGRVRCSARP
jgi:hypothetical protein